MSVRVFLSHSVAPWELAFVNGVADVAAQRGAIPIIPDRAWNPSLEPLPTRIAAQIESSDYVIAIASQWGKHLGWLNQEIVFCAETSPPKSTFIVADAGIEIDPRRPCTRMDRADPITTLSRVSGEIERLVRDQKAQRLLRGLLVGGLALLFLKGK